MKRVKFFDGYDSAVAPTEIIDSSLLVIYTSNAAYEVDYGTPEGGEIFFCSTDSLIHYYDESNWIELGNHEDLLNIGTNAHSVIDTHIADGTKHFLMLDEDNMVSDSETKTVTQQSAKAYMDDVFNNLVSFTASGGVSIGDAVKVDSAGNVETCSSDYADFIGIAQSTVATTESVYVALIGRFSKIHSGQTPGDKSYVQTDGSIGATVTSYPAGRWISATTLLVTTTP